MNIKGIEIRWLGHSGFFIKKDKNIYIDPYNIKDGSEPADIILITHSHYDHCSFSDMEKIVVEGTKIIAPVDCQSRIAKFNIPVNLEIIEPGNEIDIFGIGICAFPAYNLDKHFHPKEEGWVGYILKFDELIIYHTGDTDFIPEMQKLTGYKKNGREFIALIPIGGRFTMNVEEALESVKLIKPSLAIPIHWGSIVGDENDAKEFLDLCSKENIRAEILNKE